MMRRRGDRVLIRVRGEGALSAAWAAGAVAFDPDVDVAAHTWPEALRKLGKLIDEVNEIEQVQFWGHANVAAPYIGGRLTSKQLIELAAIFRGHLTPDSIWWWRGCYTFAGERGKRFAEEGAGLFRCMHAGHTHQTSSLPWVVFQSGLRVLRPGDEATWDSKEKGRSGPFKPRTVLVSRMSIPDRWLIDQPGDDGIPAFTHSPLKSPARISMPTPPTEVEKLT